MVELKTIPIDSPLLDLIDWNERIKILEVKDVFKKGVDPLL